MTCPSHPLGKTLGLALVAALVALAPSWSSSAPIGLDDDDDEERAIRREESRRSFVENCLMCHGEDMTTRQRLTTKQWAAEVEKMVGWGTPLPPERKQPLVDYLAEAYPSTQPAPPVERISPERALALDPPAVPRPAARRGRTGAGRAPLRHALRRVPRGARQGGRARRQPRREAGLAPRGGIPDPDAGGPAADAGLRRGARRPGAARPAGLAPPATLSRPERMDPRPWRPRRRRRRPPASRSAISGGSARRPCRSSGP